MWTDTHFPSAMRSLNRTTRSKAIEIANRLMAFPQANQQQAITTSISEARRWARTYYSTQMGQRI